MSLKTVIATVNTMVTDGVIEQYAIGGAVGAIFYIEPLSTVDIDVFVALQPQSGQMLLTTQPLFDYLTARGCTVQGEYLVIGNWPVQFLPPASPLVEEALSTAKDFAIEDVIARVFTAEHLAAMALQVGRPKDYARLLQFVEAGVLEDKRLEDILARHQLTEAWRRFERRFLDLGQ